MILFLVVSALAAEPTPEPVSAGASGLVEARLRAIGCTADADVLVPPLGSRRRENLEALAASLPDAQVERRKDAMARIAVCSGEPATSPAVLRHAPYADQDANAAWLASLALLASRVVGVSYPVVSIGGGAQLRPLPFGPAVVGELVATPLPEARNSIGLVLGFHGGGLFGTSSFGEPTPAFRLTSGRVLTGARRAVPELGGSGGLRWVGRDRPADAEDAPDHLREWFVGARVGGRAGLHVNDPTAITNVLTAGIEGGGAAAHAPLGTGRSQPWGSFVRVTVRLDLATYIDRGPCVADQTVATSATCPVDLAVEGTITITAGGTR